jgi:hypothetical protein
MFEFIFVTLALSYGRQGSIDDDYYYYYYYYYYYDAVVVVAQEHTKL